MNDPLRAKEFKASGWIWLYFVAYSYCGLFGQSYLLPAVMIWLGYLADDFRRARRLPDRKPLCGFHLLAIPLGLATVLWADLLYRFHDPSLAGTRWAACDCFREVQRLDLATVCYVPIYAGIGLTIVLLAAGVGWTERTRKSRSIGRMAGLTLLTIVLVCPLTVASVATTSLVVLAIGFFGDGVRRRMHETAAESTAGRQKNKEQ